MTNNFKGNLKLSSGKKVRSPISNKTRPTKSKVREALINILDQTLKDASWLDLCSGTGVMACEVLQKGVNRILAIEKDKKTAQICKSNFLDVSNKFDDSIHIQVICQDVISFLKKGVENKNIQFIKDFPKVDQKFDFVFLDPPYDSSIYEVAQDFLLANKWIKRSSILICECSSKSIPRIDNGWKLKKTKIYGNTSLIFLTPNQALSCFDDTGSMH